MFSLYNSIGSLLELSYYLAFLNYIIGSLLLGSPLPFPGLKRFGASMMKDAVASFIMITGFWIILSLIYFIQSIIGASPGDLEIWFSIQLFNITEKLVALKLLIFSINPILRSLIDPIVSVASSLLTTSLTSLLILRILYSIISQKGAILIALGILFYSIPLGIFKRAGSLLISFVVVFIIALPAMPSFINLIYTSLSSGSTSEGSLTPVAYPRIVVRDYSGESLSYAYVKLYSSEDLNTLIAAYQADRNGIIDLRSIGGGLPIGKNLSAEIELYGWRLSSDSKFSLDENCLYTTCTISIKTPNILISEAPYILIHNIYYLVSYSYSKQAGNGEGFIALNITTSSPDTLYITFPRTTQIIYVEKNGVNISPDEIYAWNWYGVSGYSYKISLDEGLNIVTIRYTYTEPPIPTPSITPYQSNTANPNLLESFLSDAVVTLIITTLMPAIYLTLIIMAANALSRIISLRKI